MSVGKLIWDGEYEDAFNIILNKAKEMGNKRGQLDKIIYDQILKEEMSKDINKGLVPKRDTEYEYITVEEAYQLALERGLYPDFNLPKNLKIKKLNENSCLCVNMYIYLDLLERAGKGYLNKKYLIEERCYDQKKLKELSTYALKKGPLMEDFQYLVGIENLFGFNIESGGLSSIEEIKNWVNNDFRPTYEKSETTYIKKFRDGVRKLLRFKDGVLEPDYTAEEFCANIGATGTSGSAFDPGGELPEFEVFGEKLKYSKNKFSKSVALSVKSKMKRLFSKKPALHKVNDKIEVIPKRRLIVSADYDLTLKMRYIDTWLSKWMKGNEGSMLWRTKEQKEKLWLDFMNYNNKGWRIPIDQSAFDHHVSKLMVLIVIEEIKELIKERMFCNKETKQEYIDVMDSMLVSMEYGEIIYELRENDPGYVKGEKKIIKLPWNSGVLSGWQWTSKINTICNIVEGNIAMEEILSKGINPVRLEFDATGDDQNTNWKYLSDGVLYWLSLSKSGFVIHPSKNFFSESHNEYLRLYSTKEGVNGYPARAVNKIMWKSPGNNVKLNELAKINNIHDRWDRLRLRLRTTWNKIGMYMMKDLKGSKLNNRVVELILFNDPINGGRGVEYMGIENKIKKEKKRLGYESGTWKYHINIHGEGFRKFDELFGEGQESAISKWILDACGVEDKIGTVKLKEGDIYHENDIEPVKEVKCAIIAGVEKIKKPKLNKGWHNNVIFRASDTVMYRAFEKIDIYTKLWNAPKSWVYDWIIGRIDLIYPKSGLVSSAGLRLLGAKYEESTYYGMFKKRNRERKWEGIQLYYYNNVLGMIQNQLGNRMFCI